MKTIKILSLLIFAFLFGACSDDDEVKIDSLQVFGEEFYGLEVVPVGISVSTSDPENTSYKWECDGGKFLRTQGYNFNQWQAPLEAGTYNIFCTVSCGGKSEKRQARVKVAGFYFNRFNVDPSWTKSSTTTTQIKDGAYLIDSKAVGGTANGTLAGNVSYTFASTIAVPITMSFDYGLYDNSFNPTYPLTAANVGGSASLANNQSAFFVTCSAPPASSEYIAYINSVCFEYWPAADKVQAVLPENKYVWNGTTLVVSTVNWNKADYDARFRFQWTLLKDEEAGRPASTQGWYDVFVKIPNNALKFATNKVASLKFLISADGVLTLYDQNNIVLATTNDMKTFCSSMKTAPIVINGLKFAMPSKTGMSLDNLVFEKL